MCVFFNAHMNLHICVFVSQATLTDQEGPSAGSMSTFELMSSKDLAYQMTMFDWELFSCMHEVACAHTQTQTHTSCLTLNPLPLNVSPLLSPA